MDKIAIKYHSKRLFNMMRFKGLKYTFDYLQVLALYNTAQISNLFLVKLYPLFVPYPKYIEIETTTRCNLRCIMCEHTYWNEKSVDMSFDTFKRIADQFPKLKWIGLTGIGSSFLNKDFIKMVKYVKERSIYLELYDTFFLIGKDIANELINSRVDRMIVSIDGATKETYEKIRVGSDFDKVVNNIKSLVDLKKEKKQHYPEITFHFIISKINLHEVVKFVELVHKIMGKEDTGILFTGLLHSFKEINEQVVDVPEHIKQEANKKAKEYGIKIAWNKNVSEKEPINKCTEWTMPFIFVDGTVISCCAGNEGNRRDFQKKTSLGNILEDNFKNIWYGKKYKNLRDMIHKGEVPGSCQGCPIYKTK